VYRRRVSLSREELEEHRRHVARRKEPDAPLTREQEQMLKLQTGIGNAALARAMLNRQLPDLVPRLGPPQPMEDAIRRPVVAYLEKTRLSIQMRNLDGTLSMPELVNQVRQNVPEALMATPFQIEMVIVEVLAGDTPPPVRKVVTPQGRSQEVAARILNSIPKPPKELALHAGPGTLTFAFTGEAKAQVGPVTAKADKDGGAVTVKQGDTSVTGQASFAGDSVGLKASIKGMSFDAQLRKDAGNQWSKFAATVKIPIGGDETVEDRPPLEEITAAVMQAEAAINEVAAHLAQGGSPADEAVRAKMALIKPAFEKVGEAVEARKGPQAGLKLTVGTGDPKLGTYGVVSLVIEF
jgi:hypothetical protein